MEHVIDIITDKEIPFRVVYGYRPYLTGQSERKVVAFYDRRYPMPPCKEHGQFVSDYHPETLLEHGNAGLKLYGDSSDWTIDRGSMVMILDWLEHIFRP